MSEKESMKDEETEKPSEPTIEIEDLDVTDAEQDVKGGRTHEKQIQIESW